MVIESTTIKKIYEKNLRKKFTKKIYEKNLRKKFTKKIYEKNLRKKFTKNFLRIFLFIKKNLARKIIFLDAHLFNFIFSPTDINIFSIFVA